jgi:hypothetical protein
MIFAGLTVAATPANAAIVLNANGVALTFNENAQTVTAYVGNGTTQGSIVKYAGVATISTTVVDAVIETASVVNTTIGSFDGGSSVSGQPNFLQTNMTTSPGAGSITYKFSFYLGGTYTGVGTGTPVILQNVYVNSYDLDRSGSDSHQYTEFTGSQGYTLSSNTTLAVSSSGNLLQFIDTASAGTNYSASSGSYTKGRVQVKYDNLSTISIRIGNDATGSGGLSYFALDFSVGLPWTEGSTTVNTSTTTNSFNAPPTSTNDSISVTAATPSFVTSADFGTYADVDLNPWVSVSIESLPAAGTLTYYNGSSWVAVTVGQVILVSDLDANKLRYTSNANTTNDSFTFKVSDGLLSSVSAYTLSITVSGGGAQAQTAQVITYNQPADQLINGGPLTVAPTASSNLTVTLTSSTPAVCTVVGFVITFVSVGTCTTTASQAGDSTYSAATDVTRSFQITKVPQTITFAQPNDELLATGTVTLAPTASSNLTVTMTSSTPSVCTVVGFVVTFVATGTCTLNTAQAGNSTYLAATNVSRSFQITLTPAPAPSPSPTTPAPDIDPISGKTMGTTPITLPVPVNHGGSGASCLVDPYDQVCKHTVTIPGKGTFVLDDNGKTTFTAVPGFYGIVQVLYRVTDAQGRYDTAPVTVEVLNPNPTDPNNNNGGQNGSTQGTAPVTLPPTTPPAANSDLCLVDPSDSVCKTKVTVPGVGTWTQNSNGSVSFVAVNGFVGSNTIMQRYTRASVSKLSPYTVKVGKNRGPVTVTIAGFADGSPVMTSAIKAKIVAFLKAYPDYKYVTCIGYTEGPTVLKTDAALSRARAVNGCGYVAQTALGKLLIRTPIQTINGVIEAHHERKITITLND